MIQINSLTKNYGSFHLNVSFDVNDGEVVAMIGRNGSGKTTTFKALLGLTIADGGSVMINGKDAWHLCHEDKSSIGVVMADAGFNGVMRLSDIETIMASAYPKWNKDQFYGFATTYNLPMNKPLSTFSTGMKVLAKLDMALSIGATTLILDEPTSGLDPVVRSDMLDLFLEFIQDEQHSILLSSHITSDLEKIADYIVFIHEGRIVFSMSKDDMLQQFAVLKCSKEQLPEIMEVAGVVGRRDTKFDVEILVDNAPEVRAAFPSVLCENASIDDIMTFFVKWEQ